MHEAGSSVDFGAEVSAVDGAASRRFGRGESSFSTRRTGVFGTSQAGVEPVVPAQRGIRDAARGDVLLRHARLAASGKPVFCTPSRAELAGLVAPRAGRGTDGKVIYPTRDAAEAAARELEALGARALRAYCCSRSRRGHFHLTTDSTPPAHLPLHLRVPQPRRTA